MVCRLQHKLQMLADEKFLSAVQPYDGQHDLRERGLWSHSIADYDT